MELRSLSILSTLCFTSLSCTSPPNTLVSQLPSQATAVTQTLLAIAEATAESNNQPIITNEMVDKLCLTMTLSEVEAILGRPGQVRNDGEPTNDKVQTYEWRNPDGSRLWATFVEGKLMAAGALGLPGIEKEFDPFEPPPEGPLSESCL